MRNKIAHDIDELISQYKVTRSGHFFDPETMRFFKSRVTSFYVRYDDRTAFFITTEAGPLAESRKACVRRADMKRGPRITITTIGDRHDTIAKARAYAMRAIKARKELEKK